MKFLKRTFTYVLLLALPLFVLSCNDDEMEEMEQESSIAALAQETPDLSTLVQALSKANLVSTFEDENASFTVFAPTNAAFQSAGIDLDAISVEDLTAVLTYHVVNSKVLSSDLTNGEVETLNGASVTVDVSNGVKINDANVTTANVEASNGVVHIIDKVLTPPTEEEPDNTIAGLAAASDDLSTLVAALDKAGLVATFGGTEDFTVFAPTNAAFEAAGINLDDVSVEDLTNILTYHVLADPIASSSLSNDFVQTLNGTYVEVNIDGGVSINNANVTSPDIEADNGIIHIIDEVLLPPSGNIVEIAVAASTGESPEFTALVGALTKVQEDADLANLIDVLSDEESDFTVFAPTDAAFTSLLDFLGAAGLEDVDGALLQDVLLYHVIAGSRVFSTDLASGELTTQLTEQTLVLDAEGLTLKDAGTLESANIVTAAINIQGTNGVIHAIDKVLLPARSVMDLVNFNGAFSTLKAAIETAGLEGTLAGMESQYTVFAPTNDAFAAYLELAGISAQDLLASPALADILLYHVVSGTALSTDLEAGFVPTLNGQAVNIDLADGVALVDVNADTENANVATADVTAGNGVVHIIDQVLVPETSSDIVDLAGATDYLSTLVATLSNYPDLVEALSDDDGNFTVFAPN